MTGSAVVAKSAAGCQNRSQEMGAAHEVRAASDGTGARLPRRFGAYHLFDQIGRGGMADIYLARMDTGLGTPRRVVVKEILAELSRDERFATMLIEEAKLVSPLRHGNVVQVLDLGREADRLFIAMEYVEGFDLNQLLRRLTKKRLGLPAEFAMFLVREALAALDYAHRARDDHGEPMGIVHRDVSPSNVLISFEGEVKLCDFGIARALSTTDTPSGEHRGTDEATGEREKVAGKAAYMSPEHARGDDIDRRADLFSAGIILWELCAGRRLYKGTEEKMLELAREGAVPPLPERGLPLQGELQAILDRALQYDPADRYPSAQAMLRDLDRYAARAKLIASQIRFGSFLSDHFSSEVIEVRRQREIAAAALELGPPVQIQALPEEAPTDPDDDPPVPQQSTMRLAPSAAARPPDTSTRDRVVAVLTFVALVAIGAIVLLVALLV